MSRYPILEDHSLSGVIAVRKLLCRGLWFILPMSMAFGLEGADPSKEEERRRLAKLVKQLAHDEYAKREAATDELKAAGESALPIIREAAATDESPEVRVRAQGIIRAILLANRKSKSTGMEFALVPAGEFQMGSSVRKAKGRAEDLLHKVRITHPFFLGAYEVTQEEYQKVMDANPSWFSPDGGGKDKIKGMGANHFPVEQVNWFDAIEYCNRLSKLDGYKPYYEVTDVKHKDGRIASATVKVLGGKGYRLPTEAEWEYACRAGTTTDFNFGSVRTGKEANFKVVISGGYGGPDTTVFLDRTASVGSYKPNSWGLYDMHGNVAEWCWDWYSTNYYEKSPEADPTGPVDGQHKILRGGSWLVTYANARSATRFSHAPEETKDYTGFRVARTP